MTDDDNGGDTSPLYDYAASQAQMLFCGDMGELDRPNAPVELDDQNAAQDLSQRMANSALLRPSRVNCVPKT